mmetsp:Transcript_30264/g.64403  ORF Transcript_30264/g.64403 Transcript_30264/m.64403 type:complete len:206 (-) Transcript_30264:38-655(-)
MTQLTARVPEAWSALSPTQQGFDTLCLAARFARSRRICGLAPFAPSTMSWTPKFAMLAAARRAARARIPPPRPTSRRAPWNELGAPRTRRILPPRLKSRLVPCSARRVARHCQRHAKRRRRQWTTPLHWRRLASPRSPPKKRRHARRLAMMWRRSQLLRAREEEGRKTSARPQPLTPRLSRPPARRLPARLAIVQRRKRPMPPRW